MASSEIERAWRSSGLAKSEASTHLAFVQGFEAAKAEAERLQRALDAIESAWHTGTEGRDDGSLGYSEGIESAMDTIWSVLVTITEPAREATQVVEPVDGEL